MNGITDFIMGRSNRLMRDLVAACTVFSLACVMAVTYINVWTDSIRVARQPLPMKVQSAQAPNGQITTITRSVLDDPVLTGSINGRLIILDPCSGKEKK
jgi:hypothetical protein